MRTAELRKPPSVAETIDWAQALIALGIEELTAEEINATLGVVLKHHSDHDKARQVLGITKN
jgi:hypothetical protein